MTVVEVGRKGCRCSIGRAIEVDPKGRVLLTGSSNPPDWKKREYGVTIRLTRRGKLDRSFGKRGVVRFVRGKSTQFVDVAVDAKQGIWVTGSSSARRSGDRRMITVRYRANGKLDGRFYRKGRLIGGRETAGWRVLAAGRKVYLTNRWAANGDVERLFLRRFVWRQ